MSVFGLSLGGASCALSDFSAPWFLYVLALKNSDFSLLLVEPFFDLFVTWLSWTPHASLRVRTCAGRCSPTGGLVSGVFVFVCFVLMTFLRLGDEEPRVDSLVRSVFLCIVRHWGIMVSSCFAPCSCFAAL